MLAACQLLQQLGRRSTLRSLLPTRRRYRATASSALLYNKFGRPLTSDRRAVKSSGRCALHVESS